MYKTPNIHTLVAISMLLTSGCIENHISPENPVLAPPGAEPYYPRETTHSVSPDCDNALIISETFDIHFDERRPSCEWDTNDNIGARDGYLTARTRESHAIPVDLSRQICGITFDFDPDRSGQSLAYDDELFLLFNDVVLLSSDTRQVARLDEKDGLRFFDWEALVGSPIDFSSSVPHYCLGQAEGLSTCEVPDAHITGEVQLDLEPELMRTLGDYAVDIGEANFDLVTIGDNDPENDCFHTPFSLSITIHSVWGAK